MSDRRATIDTTMTDTSASDAPVRGRQPVGGDAAESYTPPAGSGAKMRDDQTHPRGTLAVGSDSGPRLGSRGGSLEGPNTADTGGAAGISMGILGTAVILRVVAAANFLF